MMQHAIGIDIGGSHIGTCVVNLTSGTILENSIIQKDVDNQSSPTNILHVWTNSIQESITSSGVQPEGIGFAFPGPFDYERGICLIEGVNKFDRLFGLDLTSSILSALHLPVCTPVKYVNDAGAFALGEATGGCARQHKRIIALTLGTGIGSGFIADKQLVTTGPSVPANGWVYHLPFGNTIADESFSTRWFIRRYYELSGKSVSGAKDIAIHYDTDVQAQQIFKEYGQRLADFAAPLITQFNADALVLGGNISQAFPLFNPTLQERLHQQGHDIQILISTLRDNAAMLGAASLFCR